MAAEGLPLPEAILAMTQDETVCQFCGVSYLIHREYKAMAERVATLQAELDKLIVAHFLI